jgi:hypothetical protein
VGISDTSYAHTLDVCPVGRYVARIAILPSWIRLLRSRAWQIIFCLKSPLSLLKVPDSGVPIADTLPGISALTLPIRLKGYVRGCGLFGRAVRQILTTRWRRGYILLGNIEGETHMEEAAAILVQTLFNQNTVDLSVRNLMSAKTS